jgi:hypothetical protein
VQIFPKHPVLQEPPQKIVTKFQALEIGGRESPSSNSAGYWFDRTLSLKTAMKETKWHYWFEVWHCLVDARLNLLKCHIASGK